jgi:hypothetical protein
LGARAGERQRRDGRLVYERTSERLTERVDARPLVRGAALLALVSPARRRCHKIDLSTDECRLEYTSMHKDFLREFEDKITGAILVLHVRAPHVVH